MTAVGYSPVVDTILDGIGTQLTFEETDRDTQIMVLALLDQMGLDKEAKALAETCEWDELPTM